MERGKYYPVESHTKLSMGDYTLDLSDPAIKAKIDAMPDGAELTIGKGADCDIRVPDNCNYVSDTHAVIYKENGQIYIKSESKQGTHLIKNNSSDDVFGFNDEQKKQIRDKYEGEVGWSGIIDNLFEVTKALDEKIANGAKLSKELIESTMDEVCKDKVHPDLMKNYKEDLVDLLEKEWKHSEAVKGVYASTEEISYTVKDGKVTDMYGFSETEKANLREKYKGETGWTGIIDNLFDVTKALDEKIANGAELSKELIESTINEICKDKVHPDLMKNYKEDLLELLKNEWKNSREIETIYS